MKTSFYLGVSVLIVFYFLLSNSAFPQGGSLTPPGAPAPTMKSLTQVQPRTDVATLSGDSSNLYIISQPGSYYLTSNITGVSGENGISIQASNVVLDLNGFAILGLGGSVTTNGIDVPNGQSNITIRNGTVTGWQNGIGASPCFDAIVDHVHASSNNSYGITVGYNSVVIACTANANGNAGFSAATNSTITNCTAVGNGTGIIGANGVTIIGCDAQSNGGLGITAGAGTTLTNCTVITNFNGGFSTAAGSTLTNCTAYSNFNADGIHVTTGCTINGCTAQSNGFGTTGSGINAGDGCTITNCNASANFAYGIYSGNGCTIRTCTATNGQGVGVGIRTASDSTITGCTASGNSNDGIEFLSNCLITGNNSSANSNGSSANGFHNVGGSLNRVDGNTAMHNSGTGFLLNGAIGDYVVRNTAGGNTPNYTTTGGNVGPIQSASTATNPYANLQ